MEYIILKAKGFSYTNKHYYQVYKKRFFKVDNRKYIYIPNNILKIIYDNGVDIRVKGVNKHILIYNNMGDTYYINNFKNGTYYRLCRTTKVVDTSNIISDREYDLLLSTDDINIISKLKLLIP